MKIVLPEGRIKFKIVLLKIFKLYELRIFRSSLFHSITAEEKKEFRKKLCFTLNIISIPCVVCTHRSGNNTELVRWTFISENLKKVAQFPVPSSFFKGF